MANLPVDFKDAIPAAGMDGKRRVRLTELGNGVYAVEDVTEYAQQGSEYGALQVNELNRMVNGKMDSGMIVDNLPDALAVTEDNVPTGCKAIKELNGKLGNCIFSVQSDGAYITYIPEGGADAVTKKLGSGTPQLVPFPYTATDDGVAVGFCFCFAKENCNPAKTNTIAIRDTTTKTDIVTSTSSTLGNITISITPGHNVFNVQKGHKYDLINIQNPPYAKYGALYVLT